MENSERRLSYSTQLTRQSQIVQWIALSLILLLAAGLRLWQLDRLPPGLYHDEAYNGLDALSLLQGKTFPRFYEGWELYAAEAHAGREPVPTRFPVFFEGNYGREPLHVYLMALSIQLFGATPFAIRFVPAAAGILGVFTTYLAATALLGTGDWRLGIGDSRLAALFAAFTMAVLYPAVHFSRFGIRAMLFVPVATLAVYCFWQGVDGAGERGSGGAGGQKVSRWRSSGWFAAAGLLLGLSLYTYASARLLPLVFVLFVLYWFWVDRRARRRQWLNVVVMGAAALLTALPLLLFFARYPYFFVFRIAYVANKGAGTVEGKPWLTWLNNTGRVVRGLLWQGETHLRHNLPGRPYLDPIQAGFFLLGLVRQARWRRQPRAVFLLLWLLVMLLPTILSGDAPHFGRMIGAAPVVAILVGLGVGWISGQWAVGSGQWAVGSEQWAVGSGQWAVGSGQWAVGSEQYSVNSEQCSVNSDRSSFHCLLFTVYCLLFTAIAGVSLFLTARDYFGRYANHADLARDFYLADWELGRYAAAQEAGTVLYLTPTQAEMATIYFALGDPARLRSYSGAEGLVPAGMPGAPALYLVRPAGEAALRALAAFFPEGRRGPAQSSFVPFYVTADTPRLTVENRANHTWNGQIKLAGWSLAQESEGLEVTLFWQAEAEMVLEYTAFVHLLGEDGRPVAQLDRPPAGYPTHDWRRGEIIVDSYRIDLPADLPAGEYMIQTGFYYLPTGKRLGEPAELERLEIGDWPMGTSGIGDWG